MGDSIAVRPELGPATGESLPVLNDCLLLSMLWRALRPGESKRGLLVYDRLVLDVVRAGLAYGDLVDDNRGSWYSPIIAPP